MIIKSALHDTTSSKQRQTESEFGWQKRYRYADHNWGQRTRSKLSTGTVGRTHYSFIGALNSFPKNKKKQNKTKQSLSFVSFCLLLLSAHLRAKSAGESVAKWAERNGEITPRWKLFFLAPQGRKNSNAKNCTQSRRLQFAWSFPTLCRWTCLNFD